MNTIFDKIISREIPADIVYEDELVLAFKDIAPRAPVHYLIIPKQAIATLNDANLEHQALLWGAGGLSHSFTSHGWPSIWHLS
jgi:histidine triad (HIT) family protein